MNKPNGAESRANPRSNMFLGALLRAPGFSAPVRVRNMSVTGALVEGAAVPESGTEVQLVRGSLTVPSVVAWSIERRCGLRFSSLACIRDWLAPLSNSAQQRVDETVRVLKLGALPMPQRPVPHRTDSPHALPSAQFAEDLERVARLIESLGDDLANDMDTLRRHIEKLQNLDIALQTIGVVADALTGRADEAMTLARMENLRASCAAALQKSNNAE